MNSEEIKSIIIDQKEEIDDLFAKEKIIKREVPSDPIPQGTTYVVGSADATGGSFDGTQVIWNIGEVKAGGSGSVSFEVRVE